MDTQHPSRLDRAERLLEHGSLIEASQLLSPDRAMRSDDTRELMLTSWLLSLRGRFDDAFRLLDHAQQLDEDNVDTRVECARIAVRLGDDPTADAWFEHAYCRGASIGDWMDEWIDVLLRRRKYDFASDIATARCAHAPSHQAGPWFQLGLAHQQAGRPIAALDAYRHAASVDPTLPMLLNNMGAAYLDLDRYEDAKSVLEQTLRTEPNNALAWNNLATALLKLGNLPDSLVATERACALAPNYPTALQTCSDVLRAHQQWDISQAIAEHALTLDPHNKALTWTIARLQLMRGDYANGWINHEARWQGSPELRKSSPDPGRPQWSGQDLAGKTLLVWGEQGYGDVLQFVRFVPALADRVKRNGGKLIYCCFADLLPLLARSIGETVDYVVPHDGSLPAFDYHLPLCSLPLMLGIQVEDLPLRTAYLQANARKARLWRRRLAYESSNLKVGLVWTGNRHHQRNRLRSVQPTDYAKAFRTIPHVDFYSLQVDASGEARDIRKAGLPLIDHTAKLKSFDDTAAFIQGLDLVITVCTSVAHLAGGLGVPTWLLLDVDPHWVWMIGRTDTPWYPRMKLYRQQAYGNWETVFESLTHDLRGLAQESGVPDRADASEIPMLAL
jgi:tetratricopeptide (TPR) repeat protein